MSAKCSRCGLRIRRDLVGWNVVFDQGKLVGYLCPRCQTAEENAEAVINESTLDYSRASTNAFGRLRAPAKGPKS